MYIYIYKYIYMYIKCLWISLEVVWWTSFIVSFSVFLIRYFPEPDALSSLSFLHNWSLLCSWASHVACSFFSFSLVPTMFVTVARSSRMKEHESFLYLTQRGRGRTISCPTWTLFSSAVRDRDRKIILTVLSSVICTDEFGCTLLNGA